MFPEFFGRVYVALPNTQLLSYSEMNPGSRLSLPMLVNQFGVPPKKGGVRPHPEWRERAEIEIHDDKLQLTGF
jgi:hypothetical protein